EILFTTITEPDLPRDGSFVFFPQHADAMAERREVCIAAAVDRILRARLHARIALPAHIRFDVVGATVGFIDVHDVGRTDIHAVPAAVAARHVDKCRHETGYLLYRRQALATLVRTSNDAAAGGRCRRSAGCWRGRADCGASRSLVPDAF